MLIILFVLPLLADEEETEDINFEKLPVPWFTGPLIAPSGYTVKPGHISVQSNLDLFVTTGLYDSEWKNISTPNLYSQRLRIRIKAGATSWLDVHITPIFGFKETEGQTSFGCFDFPLGLSFQLLTSEIENPWPALRLIVRTLVPCGKYQKLKPGRLGTDAFGNGCWYPEIAIVSSKLWHLGKEHYLEIRFYSGYRVGVPTSVKGLSVYGGDASTRGTSYPGNIFFADLAFEYNMTQNWALASDIYYYHRNRSRFSGRSKIPVGLPSSEGFSIAPALEYNFSKEVGLIGGVWFSYLGRNYPKFANGILSLNAYF